MTYRSAVVSALAGLSLAAPLAAVAQDEGGGGGGADRRFYASPMFSYVLESDRRGLENGLGGTLAFGKKLNNSLNFEIGGYYYSSSPETGGGPDAKSYGVGGGFMLFPLQSLPWLYLPLDVYSHWGRDQYGIVPSYRSTVLDSGLGLQIPLIKSASGFLPDGTSLRIEARYRYDQHGQPQLGKGGSDSAYDGVFSVGLLIPFTHLAQPVQETPPPPPEVVPAEPSPAEQPPAGEQPAPAETPPPAEQPPASAPEVQPAPEQPAAPPAEAPAPEAVPTPAPEAAPAPVEPPAPAPAEQPSAAQPENCRPPEPGEQVTMEGCAAGPAPSAPSEQTPPSDQGAAPADQSAPPAEQDQPAPAEQTPPADSGSPPEQ